MLTSEYPRGLFGDPAPATDAPLPLAPSQEDVATEAADLPPAVPVASAPPRINTLALSKPAKRLLVLFIALGLVFGIGANTLAVINANTAERSREDLAEAYADVSDASFDYGSTVQSCAARQAGFGCLRDAANELRAAFVTLESRTSPPPVIAQA